ncbi:MAG: hypothetical protein ACXABY_00275 [Candidatus Thorarchaeota archaeon]|jgi:hypothetical protein
MAELVQPWMAAGVSGGTGTFTYDSGAAGLTFGVDVQPNTTREIEFSGAGDKLAYTIRLEFSGPGTSGFQVDGATDSFDVESPRDVAFACDSGEDFVHGFSEPSGGGASAKIRFRALYTDGTAESMTVKIYNAGTNVLVDTITCSATVIDPFLAACLAQSADYIYSARDLVDKNPMVNNDVVLEDISGNSEPDMVATLAGGTTDWSLEEDDSPYVSPSLARALTLTTRNSATDYALVNALSSASRAILAVVQITDTSGGVTEGFVSTDTTVNLNHALEYLNPSAVGSASPNPGFTNFAHGGATWLCGCIRQAGTTDWQHWSDADGTWEDIGTQTWADTFAMRDSLRIGFTNNITTGTKQIRILAIVGWFSDPGEPALEAVYDAIV